MGFTSTHTSASARDCGHPARPPNSRSGISPPRDSDTAGKGTVQGSDGRPRISRPWSHTRGLRSKETTSAAGHWRVAAVQATGVLRPQGASINIIRGPELDSVSFCARRLQTCYLRSFLGLQLRFPRSSLWSAAGLVGNCGLQSCGGPGLEQAPEQPGALGS